MDAKRAREISVSPDMKNVTYNGMAVYIESVAADNVTARVHPVGQCDKHQKVNVSSLVEQ